MITAVAKERNTQTKIQEKKKSRVVNSKPGNVCSRKVVIAQEEALRRVMGDEEFLRELFQEFINELPRLETGISNAIKEKDALKLARGANLLGGMAENLGIIEIADYAYILEQIGRKGLKIKADEVFNLLSTEIHRLISNFNNFGIVYKTQY